MNKSFNNIPVILNISKLHLLNDSERINVSQCLLLLQSNRNKLSSYKNRCLSLLLMNPSSLEEELKEKQRLKLIKLLNNIYDNKWNIETIPR